MAMFLTSSLVGSSRISLALHSFVVCDAGCELHIGVCWRSLQSISSESCFPVSMISPSWGDRQISAHPTSFILRLRI
ncbi:hypothetical protein F4680DRAFT_429509 [Xylaria scruposa]|nr:hypothetical protein F4680DRAFT_429509 [Xylaria scruposa]